MEPPLSTHFALADQIRRSSVSIPSNIAEGYGLGTRPQLVRHLRIALGSAYELSTQLGIASRLKLVNPGTGAELSRHMETVVGLLVGLLNANRATLPKN